MTDLNELMKQAKQMQEQLQKAQEDLANIVVKGEAGAGLITCLLYTSDAADE